MTPTSPSLHLRLLMAALALASIGQPSLRAQTPTAPPPSAPAAPPPPPAAATAPLGSATSWQSYESTYQNELKKIHLPLISTYITELTRLAAQSTNAATTAAIQAELRLMQETLTKGSGVMDLSRLATTSNTAPPSATPPPSAQGGKAPQALLTLTPALATRLTPTAPLPAATQTAPLEVLPLDSATWQIEALPRGDYELILQAALPSLDSSAEIQVSLASQTLSFPLHKRHLTSGTSDLRLLRLGRISLPIDVQNEPLQIFVTHPAGTPTPLSFRQLLIARAKADPLSDSPKPPPTSAPPAKP